MRMKTLALRLGTTLHIRLDAANSLQAAQCILRVVAMRLNYLVLHEGWPGPQRLAPKG